METIVAGLRCERSVGKADQIALRKDVETRTETVRDTVRTQEVEDDRTTRGVAGPDETIRRDRTKP